MSGRTWTSSASSTPTSRASVRKTAPNRGYAKSRTDPPQRVVGAVLPVIGTGSMGSALVAGLQAAGADVTVWNRTKAKAEALTGPSVRLAESVDEALMVSPLTIMSVSDHEVARMLIEASGQDLGEGSLASAYLSGMAVQLAFLPMAVGLLQGARIAESQDLSAEGFRKAVLDLYPFHIEQLLDRITARPDRSEPEVEASVNVMAAGAAEYGAALREMGIDAGMYDALHRLFTAASEAGDGETDWTCVAAHVATH